MNFFNPVEGTYHAAKEVLKKLAFAFTFVFSVVILAAQPNQDASLLFSRSSISGTARTAGAGGAFSSVGADLGSLDLNPAGLGLYRSSDISITPAIRIVGDESLYNGTWAFARHTTLQLPQGGFVFTKLYPHSNNNGDMGFESHPLRSISFALNLSSSNFFSRNQNFGGLNTDHSLVDNYTTISNYYQSNLWSLEGQLFSAANLMVSNAAGTTFTSNVHAPVQQAGNLNTRGGINKIMFGFGGNVADKIFFGFSLAVPILNYTVNTNFSETNAGDTTSQFQNYQLNSSVSESGVGFTGNLGLIYKPVSWARFGVSYALPTWYFLTENYTSNLTVSFDTAYGTTGPQSFPAFNYRLRMPMKGTVGASFYLKEHGFISVDYEFQNLGSTHYNFPDSLASYYDTAYNNYMKGTYGFSHTIRVGLEGVINIVRLRAGYSYTTTPFKSGQNFAPGAYNQAIQSASCGVGVRLKNFYFDLAYVFSYSKDAVSPYFQIPLDAINSKYMTNTLFFTIGYKISSDGSAKKRRQAPKNYTPPPVDDGDRY